MLLYYAYLVSVMFALPFITLFVYCNNKSQWVNGRGMNWREASDWFTYTAVYDAETIPRVIKK